jgi:hypothetical protein
MAGHRPSDPRHDPPPAVKLFTPHADAIWLLSALDARGAVAFGLCTWVWLFVRGPWGLAIERDLHFVAKASERLCA